MPLLTPTSRLETLGLAAATARLQRAQQHPRRSQLRALRAIIESLADTEHGRRHRLAGVDSVEAFRARVPPVTRDEVRFDLTRTVGGESDVLVPGRALGARATMSAAPRGTLIPVTSRCRGRAAREAAAAWVAGVVRRRPRILGGGVLVLPPVRPPASQAARVAGAGTRLGHLVDALPPAIRRRLVIPPAVAIASPEDGLADGARRRLIMRLALARDVRLVIGGDPAELAACFGTADEAAEAMIRDVRDGTFTVAGELPRRLAAELQRRFPADRDRARALDRGRDLRDGRLLPVEAWSLEAVACLAQGREVTVRARLDPWLDPWRRGVGPVVIDLGVLTAEAHLVHGAAVRGDAAITIAPGGEGSAAAEPTGTVPKPGPVAAPAGVMSSGGVAGARGTGATRIAVPGDAAIPDVEVIARPRPRPWMDGDPVPGPMLVGGGPPTLDGAFHEYVPEAEIGADPDAPERWSFLEVGDLEPGGRYAVFVTTFGGLLRTETRDLVEVVGAAGPTPHLRWAGRAAGILETVP